ncbi:hypothetical protein [Streptomyces sp. NPDC015130]
MRTDAQIGVRTGRQTGRQTDAQIGVRTGVRTGRHDAYDAHAPG